MHYPVAARLPGRALRATSNFNEVSFAVSALRAISRGLLESRSFVNPIEMQRVYIFESNFKTFFFIEMLVQYVDFFFIYVWSVAEKSNEKVRLKKLRVQTSVKEEFRINPKMFYASRNQSVDTLQRCIISEKLFT